MHTHTHTLQVRHPPGKGGLLGYPPCEGETVEDASGNAEGCSNYNKQPQCGRASVLEKHLVDPFTCKLNPSGGRSSCGSYDGGSDGEDTDLYLYVTSVQDGACNDGAAAWAVPCVLCSWANLVPCAHVPVPAYPLLEIHVRMGSGRGLDNLPTNASNLCLCGFRDRAW
eukprot:1147378-Pelagomonas_calceolata.AAC.2